MLQKLKEISKVKNMIWNKVIATMLVITLTFANFVLLGVVAGKGAISYAADNLEAQSNSTQHANVKFDAYFIKEGAKVHTLMLDASKIEKLYFALNVRNNGYLKNASIELDSKNYSIAAELQASEIMEKIEGNKIILKQINYGTEAIVDLPILLEVNNEFKKDDVNKQSSLILRGIYVTKDGKEVEIEKEINIQLGWTGLTKANLTSTVTKYVVNDEQKEIFLQEKIELIKSEKSLPIQKTILEIEVPKFNNILPEKVNVIANELSLTTGKQNEKIEFSNENWKYDNQTGKLTIEVENKEANGTIWAGLGKDEYSVNYIFDDKAYNAKQEQNQITTNISAKVYNYSGNEIKENTVKSEVTKALTERIGNVVTGKVQLDQNISKGNMYANCNSSNREYETKYNVKEIVEIPYLTQIKNIKIQELPEQFLDENGNADSTKIGGLNYTYYTKTLINIDNFNKILGKDGYITVLNSAGKEIGKIDVNTNQEEGNYVISYAEKQDSIILQISTPVVEGNLIINHQKAIKADLPYARNQIVAFEKLQANASIINNQEEVIISGDSELKETTTKVDMTINKQTITSENENVEIKLELNNTNEQSDLFVNPKFIIELPKNITTAKIEKAEVLFDDELKVKNSTVNTNAKGNKQLEINLTGVQTKYNTIPNTNGTTINIQARLGSTTTGQGIAVLKVENENSIQYSAEANTSATLNSYIATYFDITLDNLEEPVITVEENEEHEINIKNETIKTENLTENATQEQPSNEENEQYLKMNFESKTTEKHVLKKGDKYAFTITLDNQTPDGLGEPQWTEEDEKRYQELYDKAEELRKIEQLTDEQIAELKILNDEINSICKKYLAGEQKELFDLLELKNQNSLTEEQEKRLAELEKKAEDGTITTADDASIKNVKLQIYLPKYIKYNSVKMLNGTDEVIKDTDLRYDEENNTVFLGLGKYPEKEILQFEIQTTVDEMTQDYIKQQENVIKLNYEQLNKKEEIVNNAKLTFGKIGVELVKTTEGLQDKNKVGDEITFKLQINNVGSIDCNDVIAKVKIPDELYIKNIKYSTKKENKEIKEQNIVSSEDGINVPIISIEAGESTYIHVTAIVTNIKEDKNLDVEAIVKYRESVEEEYQEQKAIWSIKAISEQEDPETPGEDPETPGEDPETPGEDPETPGEDPETPGEDPETPGEDPATYSISGIAWIDQNPDGIKSENEKGLQQIKVMLVDVTNNQKIASISTNDKGEYEFSKLKLGDYQVIFEYDQKEYTLTEYKKTTEEEVNSDAIKVEDGIAITDVIKVSNQNVRNINIGLIKIPKFDFKLEKRVNKITVQNKKETKTYNFSEVELAKVEVDSKYINGTVVMIEYVIKVTNEGDVAGTVEKIADYMPSGMVFSSDLNPSWVQENSGNLYNTELSKISIEPGETKQISLVLRKNMTEDNTGTINNRAEITEISNKENLKDQDSTPNNKAQNEDDLSMANVIIGIKTGSIALYVILIISSLILLAVGIYFIRKI